MRCRYELSVCVCSVTEAMLCVCPRLCCREMSCVCVCRCRGAGQGGSRAEVPSLYFWRRRLEQVKIRGSRIELGEIEALNSCPLVDMVRDVQPGC